ncbi:MAG: tetratricopeptide repeat protein [Candidatus Woesearchaeota archaeon]
MHIVTPTEEEKDPRIERLDDLIREKRSGRAIDEAKELLETGVNTFDVHHALARAYKDCRRYDEALAEYRTALSIDDVKEIYHDVATVQRLSSRKKILELRKIEEKLENEKFRKQRRKRKGTYTKGERSIDFLIKPFAAHASSRRKSDIEKEEEKIKDAYEAAIEACPSRELFTEVILLYRDYHPDAEAVVKYGEQAIEHFDDLAFFYISLSNAHKTLGNHNDSYAHMWKAIEMKPDDGKFIRAHFFDRLFEDLGTSDTKICNRLLEHNNNRNNYEIIKMISDYKIMHQSPETLLNDGFFEYLSNRRLELSNGSDLEAEYHLISIEARQLDFKGINEIDPIIERMAEGLGRWNPREPVNQAAYLRIVSKFAGLKAQGFDLDEGHFRYHIGYFSRFKQDVDSTPTIPTGPDLKLVH